MEMRPKAGSRFEKHGEVHVRPSKVGDKSRYHIQCSDGTKFHVDSKSLKEWYEFPGEDKPKTESKPKKPKAKPKSTEK